MKTTGTLAALALALGLAASAGEASARDQIRIVGSSTVFPFSATVAETFGRSTNFKTPIVESTGTGGGLKLFCQGVGTRYPDITNASRRIKKSEVELCARNGVRRITEVKIGYDGIVIANSRQASRSNLTLAQVWLALAKDVPVAGKLVANPYRKWSDIEKSLPDAKIVVLGPPPTSGTRDAFVELALEAGCEAFPEITALEGAAKKAACHRIREDGAFVEAGENDNLIVQKLVANAGALGVFGFSFLDRNLDKVQGGLIDGVEPEFENIAGGQYPISRSMYFYVKGEHLGVMPGIAEYVKEFTSEKAWGEDGYLVDKGLIPLPGAERMKVRNAALSFTPLSM